MQGLNWDWQDPRCNPTWDMMSQVGNYLKFEAILRGIGGILGLIPPEMCFPRWDAIRNLRWDPNFNWRDPMWDPMRDVP